MTWRAISGRPYLVALDSGTLRAITAATPSLLFQPRALRRLLAVPPSRRTAADVEDIADFTCWLAPLRGVPEALRKPLAAHAEIRHVPAGATLGGGGNGGVWVDGEELAVVVSGQLAVHDTTPPSLRADQAQDPAGGAGRQTPNSIRGDQTRSLSFLKEWTDPAAGDAMLHGIRARRGGVGGGTAKFKSLAKTVKMLAKLRGARQSMMGGEGSGTPGGESPGGTGLGEVIRLSSPRISSVRASPRDSGDVEGGGGGEGAGAGAGAGEGAGADGRRQSRLSRLTRTSLVSPPSQPDFNSGEGGGDGGGGRRQARESITSLVSLPAQLDFNSHSASAAAIRAASGIRTADLSMPLEAVKALAAAEAFAGAVARPTRSSLPSRAPPPVDRVATRSSLPTLAAPGQPAVRPRRNAAKGNAEVEAEAAGAGAGRAPGDGDDEVHPEGPAARLLQVGRCKLKPVLKAPGCSS